MYLAYFDESGDAGVVGSPTKWFVLACVLVHESHWLSTLDQLISLRKRVRDAFGIGVRGEIKSSDLRRGQGLLRGLGISPERRAKLFRAFMVYQARELSKVTVFAVAVDKKRTHERKFDPRTLAWDFSLQRVDRFCAPQGEHAMIFPDEGHGEFIRRLLRKQRRHSPVPQRFGAQSRRIPTQRIVEDPNDRQSHESYFIQLADWNAYAAHRSCYVDPIPNCDPSLWDALGERRLLAVNKNTGGPPGIKTYP